MRAGRRGLEIERGVRISGRLVVFQDVVAIHGDRGVAEGLAGGGSQAADKMASLFFSVMPLTARLGHEILWTLLDVDGYGNVALLAPIIVDHVGD